MYGSTFPELTLKKIKVIVALAPIVHLYGVRASYILKYTWFFIKTAFQLFANGKYFVRPSKETLDFLCLPYPFQMKLCQIFDMVVAGYNFDQNNPETLPITLQSNHDSASVNTLDHFYQISLSNKFKHFYPGITENTLRYQSPFPLQYNLSKINIPVYLIGAANDLLSTVEHIKRLAQDLPVETKVEDSHIIQDHNFNHLDILSGKDAKALVFDVIVKFLNKHF